MEKREQTSKSSVLKKLAQYHKPYVGLLVLTFILLIFSNAFVLIGPYLSGEAIDAIIEIQDGVGFEKVIHLCIVMIVLYIVSSALTYIVSRIMIHVGKNIARQLREDIQKHLLTLPISFFDTKQAGDIISCLSYDVGVLNTSLTNDLIQIANSMITLVFSLVMMLWISPKLVLVLSIPTLGTVIIAKYRLTRIKPLFRQRSKRLGILNGYAEELLSGIKTIIAYQQQDTMIQRFTAENEDASTAYFKADVQGSIMGSFMLLEIGRAHV